MSGVPFEVVVSRLRRKYSSQGMSLKRSRGAYWRWQCGEWYVVDAMRNCIVEKHVDIHQAALDMGVLNPCERLVEPEAIG